jgi:tetrahydromethanopterin S-methyltransferase subunit D
VSGAVWDVVFVVVTVFGGLLGAVVGGLTYAKARRARNQPVSNVAAVGVFLIIALFSITAVLFFWWYFDLGPISWPI